MLNATVASYGNLAENFDTRGAKSVGDIALALHNSTSATTSSTDVNTILSIDNSVIISWLAAIVSISFANLGRAATAVPIITVSAVVITTAGTMICYIDDYNDLY